MSYAIDSVVIEDKAVENGFPVGFISLLAEHESWRKEVHRPTYYIHKWWARRLGSVFRAILIASCADKDENILDLFYQPVRFPDVVVFDPFMGSGTTVGEAVKLGCRAIGRDINPVSLLMVDAALRKYRKEDVLTTFNQIAESAGRRIRTFYLTTLATGEKAEVLYFFWVKVVPCLNCNQEIELFKSRVFARHASPSKHPQSKALCPKCRSINDVRYDDTETVCYVCGTTYNPQGGVVNQPRVTCPSCGATFNLIDAFRRSNTPPRHKMYAKMVLCPDGQKIYLPIEQEDEDSYRSVETLLPDLWNHVPQVGIEPGYNTNQVLNYNYRYWYQMFNARQLASLALLASEISKLQSPELKTLFACLFSGMLEFNNMFASFKGEGTGAVRHMFAHHILKPELTPLEANVWGTPKSSGSFSTLFKTRILRALEYKAEPFEFDISALGGDRENRKIFGLSQPMNQTIVSDHSTFLKQGGVYLSAGDSSHTDLPDESVDLVVTDPPFFDNVHYSQLADFFYVWLRQILGAHGVLARPTTRSPHEVQTTDPAEFAERLTAVFSECFRALKKNGLLVFTYHHSRIEGWSALYQSVRNAGFFVSHTHPIKAEMAVAIPIQQSKEPISFDLIVVCRKMRPGFAERDGDLLRACSNDAQRTFQTLQRAGMSVSSGDVRVILMGHILSRLANIDNLAQELVTLHELERRADPLVMQIVQSAGNHKISKSSPPSRRRKSSNLRTNTGKQLLQQLALLERKRTYQAKRKKT